MNTTKEITLIVNDLSQEEYLLLIKDLTAEGILYTPINFLDGIATFSIKSILITDVLVTKSYITSLTNIINKWALHDPYIDKGEVK